jgi:hypothetical protein
MIARAGQQARLPMAAIAALALLAFSTFALIRPTVAPVDLPMVSTTPAISLTLPRRPIQADATGCAAGTVYVTGDLVGDASPADVYARLCP